MKKTITLILLLLSIPGFSQSSAEEQSARKFVDDFFVALHAQDTLALRKLADPGVKLQSILTKKDGTTELSTETYSKFLESLAKIPDTLDFEEKLTDYNVIVSGHMANVITPYSLYVNGKVHHCGVNSFQLYRESEEWKLIYLVDTRKVEECR